MMGSGSSALGVYGGGRGMNVSTESVLEYACKKSTKTDDEGDR